ncbi:MAG: hypothetical protein ACM31C_02105 [Acidobacteriota bacterium]
MRGGRLGLGELIGAGPRAVGRYTGTLLAVFVVQSLVAAACLAAVAVVLANAFAHLPIWDDAVDGDLVSLVWCVRYARSAFLASAGLVAGAVLLWQLASWFLVGGLLGVLAQRPEGRGETARCFGAAGTATYLKYARLALCSVPGWMLVIFVFGTGMSLVANRIEYALTVPELLGALALGALPALVVAHFVSTVADYARVELTLRHDSHDPGVVVSYVKALAFVLRRPVTLVHAGIGWIAFALVTLGYAYLAQGHPMYGAEGALTLFVARQGVALARLATRVGVLAGQVEVGRTRPVPPRRIEPKPDAKP